MTEIIWLDNDSSSWFHDVRCPCQHHCGYCYSALENQRKRYCSDHCRYLMKRERALDRQLQEA